MYFLLYGIFEMLSRFKLKKSGIIIHDSYLAMWKLALPSKIKTQTLPCNIVKKVAQINKHRLAPPILLTVIYF